MKYLAALKLPVSLSASLALEPNAKPKSSGFHCTLFNFNIGEARESQLVAELKNIWTRKFSLDVVGETTFQPELRVLLIGKGKELMILHRDIVETVRPLDPHTDLFNAETDRYFLGNYNPHISLPGVGKSRLRKRYVGTSMQISYYTLMKKTNDVWEELQDFVLQ